LRRSSELEHRRAGRGCRGLEQGGEWAGGHAGPDATRVAGVLEPGDGVPLVPARAPADVTARHDFGSERLSSRLAQ
jgi:hypothetical protein